MSQRWHLGPIGCRQADQAFGEFRELFRRGRAFAFLGAQLHAGDQAAEVLIAGAIFGQQRIAKAVGAGDLRADVRADAELLRGHVETGGAGDVVAVEHRQGRDVELGRSGRPVLRGVRSLRGS